MNDKPAGGRKCAKLRGRAAAALLAALLVLLAGCYNYTGVDQFAIVIGVALDKAEDGEFMISFEIIDIKNSSKEDGIKSVVVQSKGVTVFEAIRDARRRSSYKLYFGNVEAVFISEELAREGLYAFLDWLYRDEECREVVDVVISKEPTARALFKSVGMESFIVAEEVSNILQGDMESVGSVQRGALYEVYNRLKKPGISLILPAFRLVENDGEQTVESDGMAVFAGDKLLGFLDTERSKIMMFVLNKKKTGIFTLNTDWGAPENLSLEIVDNKTTKKFTYEGGRVKVKISTVTSVFVAEDRDTLVKFEEEDIEQIEKNFKRRLESDIKQLIRHVQTEFGSDIFGFGNMIYRKNPKLWRQLEADWDSIFPEIEVEVSSKLLILNTAYIR